MLKRFLLNLRCFFNDNNNYARQFHFKGMMREVKTAKGFVACQVKNSITSYLYY